MGLRPNMSLVEYLRENGFVIDEDGALALTELVLRHRLRYLRENEPQAQSEMAHIEEVIEGLFPL